MLFLSLNLFAQTGVFYVAAKSGLSIREKPGANEKVIDKIPYGTKITLPQDDGEWISVRTEGMFGFWRKVKYNNKTGYIVGSYLFPVPPPKSTETTMPSAKSSGISAAASVRLVRLLYGMGDLLGQTMMLQRPSHADRSCAC